MNLTNPLTGETLNVFCPTGEGGGIDPTCSPGGEGGGRKPPWKRDDGGDEEDEGDADSWDEEELGDRPTKSSDAIEKVAPELAALAQKEYDDWDEDNIDQYAGGGICHFIAEKIADNLNDNGITATSVSSSHEQHVYVVAQTTDGVFMVDVPYSIYETGGGFNWKKIEGVTFEPSDIVVQRLDSDPKTFSQYTDAF